MKLVGRLGEIKLSDIEGVAIIHSKMLEKEYGEVVHFPLKDLSKWLKLLRIESTEDGNIKFGKWE